MIDLIIIDSGSDLEADISSPFEKVELFSDSGSDLEADISSPFEKVELFSDVESQTYALLLVLVGVKNHLQVVFLTLTVLMNPL